MTAFKDHPWHDRFGSVDLIHRHWNNRNINRTLFIEISNDFYVVDIPAGAYSRIVRTDINGSDNKRINWISIDDLSSLFSIQSSDIFAHGS